MSASANASPSQKLRLTESLDRVDSGLLNERVLVLVFESLKWDIHALCYTAGVNRRLRALARRLLWRELCVYRAPRMTSDLSGGASNGRVVGGWDALAKMMFYCGGCESTRHFSLSRPGDSPGHFVKSTRFSKTSGRSFLTKKCRGDVLYVSDPCEHSMEENDVVVGIYRGVFRGFMKSRTREFLIGRQVEFEDRVRCPYCGSRAWSMTAARLIPRKTAARRLGASDDALEYFVCLNGHLHGTCWLVPLSSDENNTDNNDEDDDDEDGSDGNNDNNIGGPSNYNGNFGNGHDSRSN